MRVHFWGVRGSVPAALTGGQVEDKILRALTHRTGIPLPAFASREQALEWLRRELPFELRSTFGGNTTCIEVRCGGFPIILDMGTGLRELGIRMVPEIIQGKGLQGIILQSHVHWDHIQGLPFWKPLYMPRNAFNCRFTFYGGKEWDAHLETVLAGQMNSPVFPVNLRELRQTAMQMDFQSVHDNWTRDLALPNGLVVRVTARKLNHPQETFGYRLEYGGSSLAFTTDHEPFAAGIPKPLVDLVRGADVWITDCQYTHDLYTGTKDGVQRLGWGHSFPEYIAKVAAEAKPGRIITMHHDPEASDEVVIDIARFVQELSGIGTMAAYEGLDLNL